jgi:uncharacterized membrane protein YfcA
MPRAGVYGAGVYGGYFGAAQGILLLAILGLALPDDLQRLNALKNVLAGIVNGVAGLVFIAAADVAWGPAAAIAAGPCSAPSWPPATAGGSRRARCAS